MTAPSTFGQMTAEKRAEALEKAAEARRARAELRNKLSLGLITVPQIIERAAEDPISAGMKLSTALAATRGLSRNSAAALMERLDIPADKRIRGLGARQREAIIEALTTAK